MTRESLQALGYSLRFMGLSFGLCLTLGLVLLWPLWTLYSQLSIETLELANQLQQQQVQLEQAPSSALVHPKLTRRTDFLRELDQVLTAYRAPPLELRLERPPTVNAELGPPAYLNLHLKLEVPYEALFKILSFLEQRSLALAIQHLEARAAGDGLDIQIEARAYGRVLEEADRPKSAPLSCCNQDPFHDYGLNQDLTNVSLRETLLTLAAEFKQPLMVSPEVKGRIALNRQGLSSPELFRYLELSQDLKRIELGKLWYLLPRELWLKQQLDAHRGLDSLSATQPLILRVWPLRYARAEDLAPWLRGDNAAVLSRRGKVHIDKRTNTIGVEDNAEQVAAAMELIQSLDVPVKQVLIEARLASVDSDYERELGLHFGFETLAGLATPGHYSLAVARLADGSLLDLKLAALEKQGHGELISSPSLYTASHQSASIEAGEEIPYQEASASGATAVVFKKAVLSLKVSPQILPGKKVLLELQINQDRPSNRLVLGVPTIATRQITTSLLIPAGQTVVLGGIYEANSEINDEGLPFVAQIPVVGWLFKVKHRRQSKRELLVFVTPKIVE